MFLAAVKTQIKTHGTNLQIYVGAADGGNMWWRSGGPVAWMTAIGRTRRFRRSPARFTLKIRALPPRCGRFSSISGCPTPIISKVAAFRWAVRCGFMRCSCATRLPEARPYRDQGRVYRVPPGPHVVRRLRLGEPDGGFKYALVDDRENELIVTPGLTIEVPIGSYDVSQGRGDGFVERICFRGKRLG